MPTPAESAPAPDAIAYERDLIRPTFARRVKWRVEAAAYGVFEAALGGLPPAWVARVGRGLGALAHLVLKKRRRVVARNLRIAFAGEKSPAEIRALTAEVFRRSGANLLCSLRTARLGETALARIVEVRDREVFDAAVRRGRGVVMVLAHMGNWEALAQWFPRLLPPGVAGATVYRPLNNPIMNARVAESRRRLGVGLFSKDDNPLGMAGFLRRGGVLGVLADQRAGKIGELVPFFGRLTSCTPIPAILARRTGAAVAGVSLRTLAPGRWELRFHALREGEGPSTAAIMGLVERMMRVSPADVFWLQNRWKLARGAPHLQPGKAPRGAAAPPAKRRRALLWPDAAGHAPTPPPPDPDDVDHELAAPAPGESPERTLARHDAAASLPIDYVVSAQPDRALRAACRRLGLGWIRGIDA